MAPGGDRAAGGNTAAGGDIPPRRRRLPAAERRETILAAATEVFAQAGYRAGKVSDVAARAGVTEPVVFQNFGTKAALFAAVVERAAAEVRASLDDLAAQSGSATDLLSHVLAGAYHGAAHHGPAQHRAAEHRAAEHGPAQHGAAHHGPAQHAGAAFGILFADAITLTAEPELTGPARNAVRAIAGHLADLIRVVRAHASTTEAADATGTAGADPEAAAWLLLSVLAAGRLRAAAMPPGLEPAVTALALQALTPGPRPW